jgi:hypothetical protein
MELKKSLILKNGNKSGMTETDFVLKIKKCLTKYLS